MHLCLGLKEIEVVRKKKERECIGTGEYLGKAIRDYVLNSTQSPPNDFWTLSICTDVVQGSEYRHSTWCQL